MARPPKFRSEEKLRIVLSVLRGEASVAETARREKVSETSIAKCGVICSWRAGRRRWPGKSFLLVADVGDLPAEVREQGVDGAVLARITHGDDSCEPIPGAPKGPQPFMSFPK